VIGIKIKNQFIGLRRKVPRAECDGAALLTSDVVVIAVSST